MDELILRKLVMIASGNEGEPITRPGEHPPCFESLEQYKAWLAASDRDVGHAPPQRRRWPGEPNYCRDCTRAYRNRMRNEGRCLFPDTRFETIGEGEDQEIVGVEKA